MTARYTVEPSNRTNGKRPGKTFVVIDESGYIANNWYWPEESDAIKKCSSLNAFLEANHNG